MLVMFCAETTAASNDAKVMWGPMSKAGKGDAEAAVFA